MHIRNNDAIFKYYLHQSYLTESISTVYSSRMNMEYFIFILILELLHMVYIQNNNANFYNIFNTRAT